MMESTQIFHLGDILSITAGVCCLPNGMSGVHAILDFMTNDRIATNQLKRVSDECEPHLFQQHPFLHNISTVDLCADTVEEHAAKLDQLVSKYGAYHVVSRIPAEDHQTMDASEELEAQTPQALHVTIGFNSCKGSNS